MMSVLLVFILGGLLTPPVSVQAKQRKGPLSNNDLLQRRVQGDEVKYLLTTDAFHSSLGQVRVAGGMVKIINCGKDSFKQAWRPLGSPLGQVLDGIVAADPDTGGRLTKVLSTSFPPLESRRYLALASISFTPKGSHQPQTLLVSFSHFLK